MLKLRLPWASLQKYDLSTQCFSEARKCEEIQISSAWDELVSGLWSMGRNPVSLARVQNIVVCLRQIWESVDVDSRLLLDRRFLGLLEMLK